MSTYLTDSQKTSLTTWKGYVESVYAAGRPCVSELDFWLKAMGFSYANGHLTLPWSKGATTSNIWGNIENYFYAYVFLYYSGSSYANWYRVTYYLNTNGLNYTYLSRLVTNYPIASYTFYTISDALYNRVYVALAADRSYFVSKGIDIQAIVGGLLLLFEFFLTWGGNGVHFYPAPRSSGTVGPYTVTVDGCVNGLIYGFTLEGSPFHIAHQSVDASACIQAEVQTELNAHENLAATIPNELSSDIVLKSMVTKDLPASAHFWAEVQKELKVYEALRDVVSTNLPADELLADKHSFNLDAYERLLLDKRLPIDADVCIHDKVLTPLTAKMLLLPDSSSEIKVDIEKHHIQRFRIRADPISYKVYNSKTDKEVIP